MSTHDNLPEADGIENNKAEILTANSEVENKESTIENTSESKTLEQDNNVQKELDEAVAKNSEEETAVDQTVIEKKAYNTLDSTALIAELKDLVKKHKIQAIKEHADEIKNEFDAKFKVELEQKKEEFISEGGNIIDFHYVSPLKKEFNAVYFDYKDKRTAHYKNLEKSHLENLKKRTDLVEELKGLLTLDENISTTYSTFKTIQEKWRNAGPIPRDKYNTVWNTYRHHTENFYDYLHLNREFRDLDFKHNLEQKLKIITRAEELAQDTNINRAFRELQVLHKMWKEDVGPVDKEHRELIWDRFSALSKQIHENRQAYFKDLDKIYEQNLVIKNELISKIKEVAAQKNTANHSEWQQRIKEVEKLREGFFNAGKVPAKVNEQTWAAFKEATKDFNHNKNDYYKNLKKEQLDNLNKKQALIKIAEENKDSTDFTATTQLMKKIQADWKRIGHVPRKDSDKIWKQFKEACNTYFDKVNEQRNEISKEEEVALEKKKQHLEAVKSFSFIGKTEEDLESIKENISLWKSIGSVPYKERSIENDYNKVLDGLFQQLDLDKKETELIKYENKLNSLANQNDDRALKNEQNFIRKKIDEVHGEIRQLENNLQFFKHAKDDNPLVKEVHKNIGKHKDTLDIWKAKLDKIKRL